MKTYKIMIFIFFICISCKTKEEKFVNINSELLYKDKQGNIYLKRNIDIINKENSIYNQTRYFDDVLYNDSVIKLKKIVDIKSFKYSNGVKDSLLNEVSDIFTDSKHIYKFQYLPNTFPSIKVLDK